MISKEKKLKAMGIQNWSLRVNVPLQSKPGEQQSAPVKVKAPVEPVATDKSVFCYCYQWEKDGHVVATMLAEYGSGNLEESNLVAAIAKALPWQSTGACKPFTVESAHQLNTPIVVLGEGLCAELDLSSSESIWMSHSPAAMLADASLKRHAWGELQKLKSSLHQAPA